MFEANNQNELLSPLPPSQNPPEPPREQPRQGRGGLRTAAIIGLILLLIVVFVIGGFAGWVYVGTKRSSSVSTGNATALDALRESVAAKVKPSVVEVYVTLAIRSVEGRAGGACHREPPGHYADGDQRDRERPETERLRRARRSHHPQCDSDRCPH
jgi:uncharacterized membrane protein